MTEINLEIAPGNPAYQCPEAESPWNRFLGRQWHEVKRIGQVWFRPATLKPNPDGEATLISERFQYFPADMKELFWGHPKPSPLACFLRIPQSV